MGRRLTSTAVHAANIFAHETDRAENGIGQASKLDLTYLAGLGVADRRTGWREACGLPVRDEEGTFEDKVRRRSEAKHN